MSMFISAVGNTAKGTSGCRNSNCCSDFTPRAGDLTLALALLAGDGSRLERNNLRTSQAVRWMPSAAVTIVSQSRRIVARIGVAVRVSVGFRALFRCCGERCGVAVRTGIAERPAAALRTKVSVRLSSCGALSEFGIESDNLWISRTSSWCSSIATVPLDRSAEALMGRCNEPFLRNSSSRSRCGVAVRPGVAVSPGAALRTKVSVWLCSCGALVEYEARSDIL